MSIFNKFKNETVITINNSEESEKFQLILFSHNIGWRESGLRLLKHPKDYDIILKKRSNNDFFMLWNPSDSRYHYPRRFTLETFLKEINEC